MGQRWGWGLGDFRKLLAKWRWMGAKAGQEETRTGPEEVSAWPAGDRPILMAHKYGCAGWPNWIAEQEEKHPSKPSNSMVLVTPLFLENIVEGKIGWDPTTLAASHHSTYLQIKKELYVFEFFLFMESGHKNSLASVSQSVFHDMAYLASLMRAVARTKLDYICSSM